MLKISSSTILMIVSFLLFSRLGSAQSGLADVIIVAEPTTNSTGDNGKITINIDLTSSVPPFTIAITGPAPFVYNNITSNPVTTLNGLRFGNYSGIVVDNSGCTASFVTIVQKCKLMPSPGGGSSSVSCEAPSEPGPGGSANKFYAAGTVNTFLQAAPSNFTFQVFHALPSYLYDQISAYVFQTMVFEITNLAQMDYSPYEIFEQNEFYSDAPYIFSFNADGSLIWVYRNFDSEEYIAMGDRNSNNKPEKTKGQLFPNPTSGIVQIPIGKQLEENEKIFYTVVNNVGQTVISNAIMPNNGMKNFTLDLGALPVGLYFIRVTNQNGESAIFTVSKL